MEGGRGGGLTLGRGNRESFFHTQLSWDRMGLPAQGQKKDDGKKRFCCRSFPYVVSKMGGGCFFRSHMAQKINTNLMRRRRTLNFPTTKSSCGTRWGKNGRSGFILAWRMDDGWWGGHQRKSKQKPQRNNKTKFTPTQPTPNPNVKQKQKKAQILSNPAAGSKSIQKRDVHMCTTQEKTQTKGNRKETNIMSCNCSYDWKRGKEWGYEFLCQHGEMYSMYECVWLHLLPLYEGRVPCSLSKNFFLQYALFRFWEYLGLRF